MNPNEMTDPKVVKAENREQVAAEILARKGAYKRLMKNADFMIFYNYIETCYNSYIESGGEAQVNKETRDFLLAEAATLHKVLKYLERQTT